MTHTPKPTTTSVELTPPPTTLTPVTTPAPTTTQPIEIAGQQYHVRPLPRPPKPDVLDMTPAKQAKVNTLVAQLAAVFAE